jgi:hypothetical protein
VLARDEEHRRVRSPSPGALHRHNVGALTSGAACPVTASAFAIACEEASGRDLWDRSFCLNGAVVVCAVVALEPAAEPPGEPRPLVEIGGGRSLFLHCIGSGSTTVVLESGAGSNAMQWQKVQSELGRTTRTCAYDRAGIRNSVAPPGFRDARAEQLGLL